MKNKPNPFIITNTIIEDQLQQITYLLKTLDSSSKDVNENVYKEVRSAIKTIDKLHAQTKSLVLAALFDYEPGVIQAFADSQFAHQLLGQKVQDLVKAFRQEVSEAEKATVAALITHHFNKYRIALHECLSREEVTLLPLLQRYLHDTDLMRMKVQVEQAFMSHETYASTLDLIY